MGATGNVGRIMLDVLEERDFPIAELRLLASERSAGRTVVFRGRRHTVQKLTPDSFRGVNLVLASAGASVSKEFAPHSVAAGAVMVDNSSAFRMDEGVPLVVPEANAHVLAEHRGIIANPNCSTAQMIVALAPIHRKAGIRRLVISTYQSVSGTGKEAMDELLKQTRKTLAGESLDEADCHKYKHPIAFNVIPQCDVFVENGYTKEEMKLVNETRKILGDPAMAITATAVRVPVFISHSESVNVETREDITIEQVRALLAEAPGLVVTDDPATYTYPTPLYAQGRNATYVGRIRRDLSNPRGIEMFVVADNLRKGAAWNAVQIAEELLQRNLLRVAR